MQKTSLSIVLILASHVTVQAAGTLEKEIACYKGLEDKSSGENYLIDELRSVLAPSGNPSKNGFYLFSDNTVLFCALPASPQRSNSQFNYYYLQLENNGGTIYLSYSDLKSDPTQPGLGYGTQPAGTLAGREFNVMGKKFYLGSQYIKPSCKRELTDETRRLLHDELSARIQSAGMSYLSEHAYMERRYKAGNRVDRQKYITALSGCTGIAAIESTVDAAIQKFPVAPNSPTAPNNQRIQGQEAAR